MIFFTFFSPEIIDFETFGQCKVETVKDRHTGTLLVVETTDNEMCNVKTNR